MFLGQYFEISLVVFIACESSLKQKSRENTHARLGRHATRGECENFLCACIFLALFSLGEIKAAQIGKVQQLLKKRMIFILNFTRPHAITYTKLIVTYEVASTLSQIVSGGNHAIY